jgi:CheY-like chemotaxis protein
MSKSDQSPAVRVTLMHWNEQEARVRAGRLERGGYAVAIHADSRAAPMSLRENPPDVFVIDLSRLPSHGRELGVWLRNQKATRRVPLVFVAGEPDKTDRVRELLPDAVYADWHHIRGAIRQAMRHAPHTPIVPGTFDSYSGVPLPKKLGIGAVAVVALLGAPQDFERTLGELPARVQLRRQARGQADVILLFVKTAADLNKRFAAAARSMAESGKLWIVWPKKASGVATDLTQNAVRRFGLDAGLVDFKISAIDATWSGLCFAQRRRKIPA